jgi:WD40 repeat protein
LICGVTKKSGKKSAIVAIIVVGVGIFALLQLLIVNKQSSFTQVAFHQDEFINDIDWRPTSKEIAIAGATTTLFSVDDNMVTYLPNTQGASHVKWSSNGDKLTIAGSTVSVWSSDSGTVELAESLGYRIYNDIVWFPNNRDVLATSSGFEAADNALWIWNTQTHNLVREIRGDNSLQTLNSIGELGFTSAKILADGNTVITSSMGNNSVRVWDSSSGQPMLKGNIVFDPDVLSANSANNIVANLDPKSSEIDFWDILTGTNLFSLPTSQTKIDDLIWNDSGSLIASSSQSDGNVIIWDTGIRQAKRQLNFQPTSILFVEWNHIRDYLVTCTEHETRIWDIHTGASELVVSGYNYIARWSPDGNKIAIIGRDGMHVLKIFD